MVKVRLVLAALLLFAVSQAWSELKVENMIWAEYSSTWLQTNYAPTNVVVNKGGQFYFSRAYITLQGDIGKDPFGGSLKGRVTLDIANPATPLKYAYLDYKIMGWDPLVFTFGLLKTQFGNIANWEYPLPVKDATELYTNSLTGISSADFGVALSGNVLPIEGMTKNLFSYYVQLINGAGYKTLYSATTTADNSMFALLASAYLSPIDGTKIGFSYRTEAITNNSAGANPYALLTNVNRNSWAIMASAQDLKIGDMDIPVDFLFQYIYSEYVVNTNYYGSAQALATNLNANVLTVSLGFGLFDKVLLPYVRYDMVNELTAAGTTNTIGLRAYQYNILMFGLDYRPTKNMTFKPFVSINTTTGDIQAMLQGEFKLNFSVWQ